MKILQSKYIIYFSVFLGIFLRLRLFGDNSGFWSDELASIWFAKQPFDLTEIVSRNLAAPFYYSLKIWLALMPDSEMSIKVFSLLLSISSLLFSVLFKRPLLVLFLAVNPISLALSLQVKSGAFAELITLIFLYFYSSDWEGAKAKLKQAFLALMLLLSNYFSIFILLPLWALKLREMENNRFVVIGIFLSIWAMFLIYFNFIDFTHLNWMNYNFSSFESWLRWTQQLPARPIFYLLAGLIVSAAFIKQSESIYKIPFVASALLFFLFIFLIQKDLAHDRYLTPVFVTGIVMTFSAQKKRAVFFSLLLLVFAAVSADRVVKGNDSWKVASQEICKNPNSGTPQFVWGHNGLEFYFRKDCAKIIYSGYPTQNICGRLLIHEKYAVALSSEVKRDGHSARKIKSFGLNTIEPLTLLEIKCL